MRNEKPTPGSTSGQKPKTAYFFVFDSRNKFFVELKSKELDLLMLARLTKSARKIEICDQEGTKFYF